MHENITPAGYIVTDNELIHGCGAAADAAWKDACDTLRQERIVLLGDDDDSGEQHGSWMRESDLVIRSATRALLDAVQAKGGAIGWRVARGVACTHEEHEVED